MVFALTAKVTVVIFAEAGVEVAVMIFGAERGGIMEKVVEEEVCPVVQTLAPQVLLARVVGEA